MQDLKRLPWEFVCFQRALADLPAPKNHPKRDFIFAVIIDEVPGGVKYKMCTFSKRYYSWRDYANGKLYTSCIWVCTDFPFPIEPGPTRLDLLKSFN